MVDLGHVKLSLIETVDDAHRMLSWLGERREDQVIGLDLETGELPGNPKKDALSPYHGRIRLAQLGDKNQGWAIPWEQWNGVFFDMMRRWEGRLVVHNGAFEGKWLTVQTPPDFQFPWHRVDDTMIAAHIVDPLGSGALKTLTRKHVNSQAAAMQQMLDDKMAAGGWSWGSVPINLQEYWSYGALDPVLTCYLWDFFKDKVAPGGVYADAYDLEMGVRATCTRMEVNGARVDLDYSARKYTEFNDYADSVRAWAHKTHSINPGSTPQLIHTFEKHGVEITEFTAGGSKKMDKDQLKKIAINHKGTDTGELAAQVLNMRKASKLATTYFANFSKLAVDGLVHPNIRTLGARTGRMSITDPALQTLNKGERTVRDAFIARDPDNEVLISSDLDQVEFRIMANLSGDPNLMRLFQDSDAAAASGDPNGDAFTYIMQDLYGDPSATKKDKRRKLVKSYIYSRLFGAGLDKMALTAGVPVAAMRTVADAFDVNYPGVTEFIKKIEDIGSRRQRSEGQGYVNTVSGRRLPCDDGRVYTLVNYLIQGSAAEIFKRDILKCAAAGLEQYMVVPVHDELVFSVPRADAAELAPIIQESMTTHFPGWDVPLTSGISGIGSTWGDLLD